MSATSSRQRRRPYVLACVIGTLLLHGAATTAWAFEPSASGISAEQRESVRQAEAARVAAIAKVAGSVVCVYGNDRQGGGSGVLIDANGLAVTNHHVVAGAGIEGWAGLADGRLYRWHLIGTDPGGDVALIQLEGKSKFPFARLGNSDLVRVGDWALAMGNPFVLAEDFTPSVSMGIVSGVERFQPAGGKNQLLYGNCIQVDAAINPGNSGGPLFNMQSQVIGINGRGSFKERGRVHVGLGYAISSKQVGNFIPDLLATKLAQHGTLDALFTNRQGHVICSTIDLDSAAARAGLQLGDEMISFEGSPIHDANQFTNLITTVPAGWPARLVCRRQDREFSLVLRLSPLPYTLTREEEPEDGPPGPPQPPVPPKPRPGAPGPAPRRPQHPRFNLADAGSIRDAKLNAANAARLIARWHNTAVSAEEVKFPAVWRVTAAIVRGKESIGRQRLLLARDGRFRLDYVAGDATGAAGYDGQRFWRLAPGRDLEAISLADLCENPLCAQAAMLAAALQPELLTRAGKVTIDGSDRVGSQPAYRLLCTPEHDKPLYFWLSLNVDGDLARHELLAVGTQLDPVGRGRHVSFSDWSTSAGFSIPWQASVLRDPSRDVDLQIAIKDLHAESTVEAELFRGKPVPPLGADVEDRSRFQPAAPQHPATPPLPPGAFAAAIAFAQPRTVKVYGGKIGREPGFATGLIVDAEGHILTAAAALLGSDQLHVVLSDGSHHPAKIVRRSPELSVALLKIEAPTPNFFDLAKPGTAKQGDWVLAISNAFGVAEGREPLSASLGVLSLRTTLQARRGVEDFEYTGDALLLDVITGNPGVAGGALINADGQLIGMLGKIIESRATGARLNYAVPVEPLARFLANDSPVSPQPAAPSGEVELGLRLFATSGLRSAAYVDRVLPHSAAEEAGLKPDDLVLDIADQNIATAADYRRIVKTLVAGKPVTMRVKRKNEIVTVTITPRARTVEPAR
ncbi:MAG: trypsin-like peptidase domain-containing protein [Planctomycetia bacterium]|nr:trypsin-like peptidase domain-containing protein [Planctomycetia bacterium]